MTEYTISRGDHGQWIVWKDKQVAAIYTFARDAKTFVRTRKALAMRDRVLEGRVRKQKRPPPWNKKR
jgi:hypothetical protein